MDEKQIRRACNLIIYPMIHCWELITRHTKEYVFDNRLKISCGTKVENQFDMVYSLTWPTKSNPFEMFIFSVTAQFEVRAVFCQSNRIVAVVREYDVDSYALETSGNVCTPGGACGITRDANSFGHILHNFMYQSKIVYEIYFKLPKFYQLVWFVFLKSILHSIV